MAQFQDKRLVLQGLLEDILGTSFVYFQPPLNVVLTYPCIIYKLIGIKSQSADNEKFHKGIRYSIMVIYTDPDTTIIEEISKLDYCTLDQTYVSDNLYHAVFTIIIY